MRHVERHAGWVAALVFAAALLGCGALLEGYSQRWHPVALLGADGVPGAWVFNMAGLVLPGLLAAVVALALYRALPPQAGWLPRIGARLLLLSALAFAAQGVLPLDPRDLDGQAGRLHAAAWMVWWIAFVPGALLLAAGVRGLRLPGIIAACAVAALSVLPVEPLPPALAQRIAFAAWFGWQALAPWLAGSRQGY
ncbi:DUF998 domain-containing protein [Luteimonas suaedae]|uniref:DUF998 domain-containing protein n=1 Tax=Luteimonas suaedae TaxID=2605430 RepID=UPI0011ECF297|nr:DUF998 domain-containing protein [Luteimonas suaedae]